MLPVDEGGGGVGAVNVTPLSVAELLRLNLTLFRGVAALTTTSKLAATTTSIIAIVIGFCERNRISLLLRYDLASMDS